MKIFQGIIALYALLFVGVQTLRHAYVLYVEPRDSVLDRFDEVQQEIDATESMDELLRLYADAHKKVKAADEQTEKERKERAASGRKVEHEYDPKDREPYTTARKLRSAIEERELHQKELRELHFYWIAGAALSLVGAAVYFGVQRWAGLSLCILGYVEMAWATCPAYVTFGWPVEFEQLLQLKLIYSLATLAILLIGWVLASRAMRRAGKPT